MKKIVSLLTFLTVTSLAFQANAQTFKIRSNIGFSGYGNPFDGYYTSFDVGIPIIKSIEIDPSFSFYSDVKHKKMSYIWDEFGKETTMNESTGGYLAGDMQLFININPFIWLKNERLNKTDFGIGIGYGIKVFSDYYYNNTITSSISYFGIANSLSAKLFYNYHFDKYFIGVIAGIKELNDEGVSILGLQFGINID